MGYTEEQIVKIFRKGQKRQANGWADYMRDQDTGATDPGDLANLVWSAGWARGAELQARSVDALKRAQVRDTESATAMSRQIDLIVWERQQLYVAINARVEKLEALAAAEPREDPRC